MKILLICKNATSLTGAGTYEAVLSRELPKRHEVGIYRDRRDLEKSWDLAHCTDLKHLPADLPKKIRCPLLVDVHDYYWVNFYPFLCLDLPLRFLFQKYRSHKYRKMLSHIDGVVLHSRFMQETIPHHKKYLIFHFGLDYRGLQPRDWREKENLILFVGGDYFRKGLPRLLRALPEVVANVPDARLVVVGKDYAYARAFARFLGRGLPVEIINGLPLSEVYELYGKAKVLVLPSEIEALSLVSAEATMAGVPPVLADVGGMPEVVRDGKTGFLFPLKDTDLLADRIVRCLTDQELSERLVRNGQEFFGQFTIEKMMNQIEAIYSELVIDSNPSQK